MTRSLWLVASAVLFLSFSFTEMQGSDLWWNIAAGREIIQTKTLWLVDAWSYSSAGSEWKNHEWLADIIYYGWVSLLGVESIVYWKFLLIVTTFVLLQQVLYRGSRSWIASYICAGLAIAIAAPFLDIRPQLYSLMNFSLLLFMLLNRPCATWNLAVFFIVWVNLHGGFFFGVLALGILLFPWRDMRLDTIKPAVITGLICTGAALLNPSGVESIFLPLTYAFDAASPFRQLGEWLPPFAEGGIRSPAFFWAMYATPVVALSYMIPVVRREVSVPWEGLILCALTLAMAVTSRRFIPFFAISFALFSAPVLGLALRALERRRYSAALAGLALVFGLFRLFPYPLASGPAYHYLTAHYSYPVDTIDFMQANKIRGKVFALYNWGGYIHWRTDGDLRVFIDGRADTIYSGKTYLEYVDVLSAKPGWMNIIERSGADYFLWNKYGYGGPAKLQAMTRSGRWKYVYQDSVSVLLARSTVLETRQFKLGPETPYRDLSVAEAQGVQGGHQQAIEWASKVRRQIPYHREACNVLFEAHIALGNAMAAEEISSDCRSYFPSVYLRR
jgi:hypothetical protein